uniref:NADH:ubiquinone reductase (H(+)-translocating) n=1 Tax=Rhizophysa eysenhardtii TaxID=2721092 RepID=A0A0S2IB40_9CNID|nr:NADH dehydrogenase subunit 2 [Rhizophysa eysenhardtii]
MLYIYISSIIFSIFIISKIQNKINKGNISIFVIFLFFILSIYYKDYLMISYLDYSNWKNMVIIFMILIVCVLNNLSKETNLEEWVLTIVILIGSFVVISCDHLLVLYLGLELQTFSLFILISKNKFWIKGSEAGLKYFILGALSSGVFLLGLVLIFSEGYSLTIQNLFSDCWYENKKFSIALMLIILSLFFKIGLFPLHFWIPDVYEGSSWRTLGIVGTLPKISTVYLLIQIKEIPDLLLICALISIIIGTLGALNQSKLKRLLAYSGISHMGFIMLILSISSQGSFTINNVYLLIYMVGLISIIILTSYSILSVNSYLVELSNNKLVNSILGISWIILFLSIAGIPPFSGFISKWLVLWSILEEGYIMSSVICILFSAIAAGYYLRLVKITYFQKDSNFVLWKSVLNSKQDLSSTNFIVLGLCLYITSFLIIKPCPLFLLLENNFININ